MVKRYPERLKKLRHDKEISQAQLGLMLGMSQAAINKWEHGESEPAYDMLIRLALYYEVTTDYLLGLTDDMNPPTKGKRQ